MPIGAGGTGGISLLGEASAGYLPAFPLATTLVASLKQTFQSTRPFLTDILAVAGGTI